MAQVEGETQQHADQTDNRFQHNLSTRNEKPLTGGKQRKLTPMRRT